MTTDTPTPPPAWLEHAIRRGFLQLVPLCLAYGPAPEMIQTTLMSWTRIFQNKGIDDAEHDPARIAVAFDRVAGEVTAWPAPKQVLDLMPDRPRPYFHKLPAPERTPEEAAAEEARRRAIVEAARSELTLRLRGAP